MKKARKTFAILLGTGMVLNSMPYGIVSAEEINTDVTSTIEADGTILTRIYSDEYRYTPDVNNRTYRDYNPSSVFLVTCTDAEAFQAAFSEKYYIEVLEDGRLCVTGKDAPSGFSYAEPLGDSEWEQEDAKAAAIPLLRSGLVTEMTLQSAYHEYRSDYIPTVGTMTVYADRAFTDSDFSWLNSSDYKLNGTQAHIIAGDDGDWDKQYSLMKTILETMPSVYAVYLRPYAMDAIWNGATYYDVLTYTAQLKGDPDNDTQITPDDAYHTLCYYAKASVGADAAFTDNSDEAREAAAFAAADVNGDGVVNGDDAYLILRHYAAESVGGTPDWD